MAPETSINLFAHYRMSTFTEKYFHKVRSLYHSNLPYQWQRSLISPDKREHHFKISNSLLLHYKCRQDMKTNCENYRILEFIVFLSLVQKSANVLERSYERWRLNAVTSLWTRPAGAKDFSVLHKFQTDFGANAASCPVTLFPAVKHPRHKADHLRLRKSGALPKLLHTLAEHFLFLCAHRAHWLIYVHYYTNICTNKFFFLSFFWLLVFFISLL
jgi:hypothetical protein